MLPDFRVRQRDYLLEITRAITQELDIDKLLERILRISIEMLAGQAGLIAMRSEMGEWHVKASHALTSPFLKYVERILADISSDPKDPEHFALPEINRLLQDLTRVASLGLLTGVGLPLVAGNQVVGVIFIFRGYAGSFSKNDRALLSSFADQAAIAVRNALLYQQVTLEKGRTDALLDSVADGILIISNDLVVQRCNRAFAKMVNKSPGDLVDRSHQDVIQWVSHPKDLTLEQAVAGGWPLTHNAHLYVEGDLVTTAPEKPPVPVGITYAPMHSPDGMLLNIIASVRDITRFRQAEELKSTFISIVSHELKTPVALIKGYASTLRREDVSWDEEIVQDSLKVIEEETDRLAELIENLLDASRLQADEVALKRSDILVSDIARRMAERFQTQTKKHEISVDFPKDFPVILADEVRIEQVFSNLISNAIKYSPVGKIQIKGEVRENLLIICVSDEGPGIDPQDVPFIFDRFYRSPEMARNTKGAGLGLYLTRAIIAAHNGRIWVDVSVESGGRICFSLPRGEDPTS
jgi:signal transduction histidine kinase